MAKHGPVQPTSPSLFMPTGTNKDISPSQLALDPANLRLLEAADERLAQTSARLIGQPSVQRQLQELMSSDSTFDVASLIQSILANTFLRHEKLIVAPLDSDQYVVLEGNRRLTAVRQILHQAKTDGAAVSSGVKISIDTLPCLVLDGPAISGDEKKLAEYRRNAEVYVGMRHLMGAKEWAPASRYEFQSRLIDEGWTPSQIAKRFARPERDVIRDMKAQRLFNDFQIFRRKHELSGHLFTYNAFADAARSPDIMDWLEWSDDKYTVGNKSHEKILFTYIVNELVKQPSDLDEEGEGGKRRSAENAIRRLRDMLKLDDPDILGAMEASEFATAKLLFESRKEGKLSKRLESQIRALNSIATGELSRDTDRLAKLLEKLIETASHLLSIVRPVSAAKKKK